MLSSLLYGFQFYFKSLLKFGHCKILSKSYTSDVASFISSCGSEGEPLSRMEILLKVSWWGLGQFILVLVIRNIFLYDIFGTSSWVYNLLQDLLSHVQQKEFTVSLFLGLVAERMWNGLELELATQSLEEPMPFDKNYFCPWAAAVWTTAESESAMTEIGSCIHWLCPVYSAEEK